MIYDLFSDEKLDSTENIRAYITASRAKELEISLEKAKFFAATYKQKYKEIHQEKQKEPPKNDVTISPRERKIRNAFEKQFSKLKILRG